MKSAQNTNINLLDKDNFSVSAVGKFLIWSLSVGRYIVVFTELIVILSFLSRFTLDKTLTDLNSDVERKKNIILSYGDIENEVRDLQSRLELIKLQTERKNAPAYFDIVSQYLPGDTKISQLIVNADSIKISAKTTAQIRISQFVAGLKQSKEFTDISIASIESEPDTQLVVFSIDANIGAKATPKLEPKKKTAANENN